MSGKEGIVERVFDLAATEKYEEMWWPDKGISLYHQSVLEQLKLAAKFFPDPEQVLELGPGPANSTINFLEGLVEKPGFSRLTACDLSPSFAAVAAYKLGLQEAIKEWQKRFTSVGSGFKSTLDRLAGEMAPFKDYVNYVNTHIPEFPFPEKELFDLVVGVQVMHWLAYPNPDSDKIDLNYLGKAFSAIRKRLKTGGGLVLDTSGNQYDFRDETYEGQRLKDMHFLTHPVMFAFATQISHQLIQRGLDGIDPYHVNTQQNMYDEHIITSLLKMNGFNVRGRIVIPDQTPLAVFIQNQRGNAGMRYFTRPELAALPFEIKAEILNTAMDQVLESIDLTKTPNPHEILVFFAAKAV
jgi:SAM-dependent methyltransferase